MRYYALVFAFGLLGLSACGEGAASTTTRTSATSAERTRLESQRRSSQTVRYTLTSVD